MRIGSKSSCPRCGFHVQPLKHFANRWDAKCCPSAARTWLSDPMRISPPPGLKPLMLMRECRNWNCFTLGIIVRPIYRNAATQEINPSAMHSMSRDLHIALEQANFAFVRQKKNAAAGSFSRPGPDIGRESGFGYRPATGRDRPFVRSAASGDARERGERLARVSPVAVREAARVLLSAVGGRSCVAQAAALFDSRRARRGPDTFVLVSAETGRARSTDHACCRTLIRRSSCRRACKFTAAFPIGYWSKAPNCSTECRQRSGRRDEGRPAQCDRVRQARQEELGLLSTTMPRFLGDRFGVRRHVRRPHGIGRSLAHRRPDADPAPASRSPVAARNWHAPGNALQRASSAVPAIRSRPGRIRRLSGRTRGAGRISWSAA